MTHHYGFTLIEVLVTVAVLAVLTSVALYSMSAGDKISEAEGLVLQQALLGYIPEQMQRYYVRGDAAAWTNRVAEIQSEMAGWEHLQSAPRSAAVYRRDGITLRFQTSYQDRQRNNRLRDVLRASPVVEEVTTSGQLGQLFTVKYKIN